MLTLAAFSRAFQGFNFNCAFIVYYFITLCLFYHSLCVRPADINNMR